MRHAQSTESAHTLLAQLDGSAAVSGLVPSGFERYLRILSPVTVLNSNEPGAVPLQLTWSHVCEQLGGELRPNTLWQRDIVGADPSIADWYEPGFDTLSPNVRERVGAVLHGCETENRIWYFASWVGYGAATDGQPVWLPSLHHGPLELSIFERWNEPAHPFSDPLIPGDPKSWTPLAAFGHGVPAAVDPPELPPMYWWPDGHDWVLGQALYGRSMYLACGSEIADAVLATPGIEAIEVTSWDEAEHEE